MGKNKHTRSVQYKDRLKKHEALMESVDEVLMDMYAVLDYTADPVETQQALYWLQDLLAKVYKRTYKAIKTESQAYSVRSVVRTPYPQRPESYKRRVENAKEETS